MSQAEFIRAILERDARNIYRAQQFIVSQRIYLAGKDLKATRRKAGLQKQSGTLEKALSNPEFYMKSEGEKFVLAANYPLYIRFLDMKNKGNWRIFNHQVWDILYNNALSDIKKRYGEAVTDYVGNALRAAFQQFNKK